MRGTSLDRRQIYVDPSAFRIYHGLSIKQGSIDILFRGLDNLISLFPGIFHLYKLSLHNFELAFHRRPLSAQFGTLPNHLVSLSLHFVSLTAVDEPSEEHHNQLQDADASEHP